MKNGMIYPNPEVCDGGLNIKRSALENGINDVFKVYSGFYSRLDDFEFSRTNGRLLPPTRANENIPQTAAALTDIYFSCKRAIDEDVREKLIQSYGEEYVNERWKSNQN